MTSVQAAAPAIGTLRWRPEDCAVIQHAKIEEPPVIAIDDVRRVSPMLDVWDAWPLAGHDGAPAPWRGGELWFALAAPAETDPERRHYSARLHHFRRIGDRFEALGPVFPDDWAPGSREWSGSARLDGDYTRLYFTAAGTKGECSPTYRQRLFVTRAVLSAGGDAAFGQWSEPEELLTPGGPYLDADGSDGQIGEIKAFRDPFPWREPGAGDYLLFTASSAVDTGPFNGLIGIAAAGSDGRFRPLSPLVDATGTNNELERPHIVRHGGRLYLFWSTQAKVFAPGIAAPTGLYGATAPDIGGPWELLNGHGLVFANPHREPFQAYSWWVLPDLSVASFIDYWGIDDPDANEKPLGRDRFGGTFAPFLRIALDGTTAQLMQSADR
mgnify:CR=1 FL=1